jgi:hypothetical protein
MPDEKEVGTDISVSIKTGADGTLGSIDLD